jgi:hypothetical protein
VPGTKGTQRGPGHYRVWDHTPSFAAAREPYPSRGLPQRCYNAPTVGTDSVVQDSKRERGVHAPRYAVLGTRSSGGSRRPGSGLGLVPVGPPLALAASRGPGVTHSTFPARKWRAMGRIEHTLLDGEFSVRPNRPKTFARNPTIPQKVPDVSIYDKGRDPLEQRPGLLD